MNKNIVIGAIVLAIIILSSAYILQQQSAPQVIQPLSQDVSGASQTVIDEILQDFGIDEVLPGEDPSVIEENAAAYEDELFSEF